MAIGSSSWDRWKLDETSRPGISRRAVSIKCARSAPGSGSPVREYLASWASWPKALNRLWKSWMLDLVAVKGGKFQASRRRKRRSHSEAAPKDEAHLP